MINIAKSGQQVGEPIEDDVLHQTDELVERWNNRLTFNNLALVKRYVKGELWVHVHLQSKVGGKAEQFCVLLQGVHPDVGIGKGRTVAHSQDPFFDCSADRDQVSVFLVDVESMEVVEQLVPAFVGFERADKLHSHLASALYFGEGAGLEVFGTTVNRELNFARNRTVPGADQLACEKIQTGPEVVDSVASDCSEPKRSIRVLADPGTPYMLPRLRVILADRGIGVSLEEGFDFPLKFADVFFGPFDLDPRRVLVHG